MSASAQERMAARLFLEAVFPTMQVLLDDDPKLHRSFENFHATVQFGARDGEELLCCHLVFDGPHVDVIQGPAEKPNLTLTFSSIEKMNAARVLAETDGLSVRVINMHTIKPIDREAILKAVTDTRRILTIEEHNVIGGLGDAVGNVIAESGKGCVFKKHGLQDTFAAIGYAEDLYAYYGLDANGVVDKVREMMGMEFEPDEDWNDE